MLVQACLNGSRAVGFHPRLPTTPNAIIADAVEAVRAGAAELHVHVRNEEGRETLHPDSVNATVAGLRRAVPGTLIGISTGAWIERDDARRLALIDQWRALPDHASVNVSEEDAPQLFARLKARGIAVEAGLATVADAERLVRLDLAKQSLRMLLELGEDREGAEDAHAVADGILAVLREARVEKPILIHGAGNNLWSFVERAARAGFSTRVGLEDGDTLPDDRSAGSNAEMVAAAVQIMRRG
jgi:uncharacterized protein (DUF849 family)